MSDKTGWISDTTSFIDGWGEGCSQATGDIITSEVIDGLISNTAVGEG